MTNTLQDAIREHDIDVEYEAARLVRLGVPPWEAMERAVKTRPERIKKKREYLRALESPAIDAIIRGESER